MVKQEGASAPEPSANVTPREIASDAEIKKIRLNPSGTREVYSIPGVVGLWLEVRPSGAMSWVLRYWSKPGGRVRALTIGRYDGPHGTVRMGLADARKAARAARARVDLGGDPMAERIEERAKAKLERSEGGTVEAIGRRCLDALELRPSTRAGWERIFTAELVKAFGDRRLDSLTRAEIRAWGAKLAKRAPYMANRAFEVLRRIASWAVSHEIINATPFVGLEKPASEESRDRVLSTEEIVTVWRALLAMPDDPFADAARLLFLTGARLRMVTEARVRELELQPVDEARWVIPGAKMKGGKAHVVPLSKQACALFRNRLTLQDGGYLFPKLRPAMVPAKRAVSGAMHWSSKFRTRLDEKTGKLDPPWTIHDIRRTVATHMREDLGVRADVVAAILSHTPPGAEVTRVYQRAELLPERRDALQRWADWIEARCAGGETRYRSDEA